MVNARKLFIKTKQSPIRECPNLDQLDDVSAENYHTMGKKLFLYVNTKFSPEQVGLIEQCLQNEIPIHIHGVHMDHLPYCLQQNNLTQIPFEDGSYTLGRRHKNSKKKSFNYKRPFFIKTISSSTREERVLLITFPSEEYLNQYSELLYAFIKLGLQQIITPIEQNVADVENKYNSKFDLTKAKAQERLKWFLNTKPLKQHFYPDFFNQITSWSGLDVLVDSNWIQKDDIVVIGYVEQLRDRLIKKYTFSDMKDKKDFTYFGIENMYGISVLLSPRNKRRVVLLGCKHSFWGKTAAKIVEPLLQSGAREIVYFAKAGTTTGLTFERPGTDANKHFINIIGGNYFIWEDIAGTENGETRQVLLDGMSLESSLASRFVDDERSYSHLSVPTVVGEDAKQHKSYKANPPASIDNEISYIAETIANFRRSNPNSNINFTCIHLMTDLVTSRISMQHSAESGLDEDELDQESKLEFFDRTAKKIRAHIGEKGGANDITVQTSALKLKSNRVGAMIQHNSNPSDSTILSDGFSPKTAREIINLFNLESDDGSYLSRLIDATANEPIVVSGESGVGKSVLAEASFVLLRHQYELNAIPKPPIYINLSSYEKQLIQGSITPKETFANIATKIHQSLVAQGPSTILFDGIDELSPFREEFITYLQKQLRNVDFKKCAIVFFCRRYRSKHTASDDNIMVMGLDITARHYFVIGHDGTKAFNTSDRQLKLSQILSLITPTPLETIQAAREQIKTQPEFSVNLRLLHLISKQFETEVERLSFVDFFFGFFREYISDNLGNADVDRLFEKASKFAFEFLIEGEESLSSSSEDILCKRIATQSVEMLCFLAASYLDKQIFDIKNYQTNRVFPHLINKYSKDLMQKRNANNVFETIKKALDTDETGLRYRGFLTYLLGRLNEPRLKNKCITLIKQQFTKLNDFSDEETLPVEEIDGIPLSLTFERSIDISLIYLGISSEAYIKKLVENPESDAVNRGFHLAYYGDYNYFKHPDMLKRDDCSVDFVNTKNNLIKNITDSSNPSNTNLAVYTLFSLGYSRHANINVNATDTTQELINLANDVVLKNNAIFDHVRLYVESCLKYFESPLPPDIYFVRNTLKLKQHKRAGWISKKLGRQVLNSESVQAHIGYAAYLASVYLPETNQRDILIELYNTEFANYDKYTILRMILIHDIGEYEEGDIVSPFKTVQQRKTERDAASMMRILPRSERKARVLNYSDDAFDLWEDFEKCQTINAKIARDIDRIECLVQLEFYLSKESTKIKDADGFWQDVYNSIQTDLGRQLVSLICEKI